MPDNPHSSNGQAMASLQHSSAALRGGRTQNGELARLVDQEDACVIVAKAARDQLDHLVEKRVEIVDHGCIPGDFGRSLQLDRTAIGGLLGLLGTGIQESAKSGDILASASQFPLRLLEPPGSIVLKQNKQARSSQAE